MVAVAVVVVVPAIDGLVASLLSSFFSPAEEEEVEANCNSLRGEVVEAGSGVVLPTILLVAGVGTTNPDTNKPKGDDDDDDDDTAATTNTRRIPHNHNNL